MSTQTKPDFEALVLEGIMENGGEPADTEHLTGEMVRELGNKVADIGIMRRSTQAEVEALDKEYRAYADKLKRDWLAQNPINSRNVIEVMSPRELAEVHETIARWGRYITPLAEAWWKARGYAVTWPDDNSEPMMVHKLETA